MKSKLKSISFDQELLKKYDKSLPRYTSYPPATELKINSGEKEFK